jgi:hypothetical protein
MRSFPLPVGVLLVAVAAGRTTGISKDDGDQ